MIKQKIKINFIGRTEKGDFFEMKCLYNVMDIISNQAKISKTQARRLITQKAIKINNITISDYYYELNSGDIFQVGKRRFFKIVLTPKSKKEIMQIAYIINKRLDEINK